MHLNIKMKASKIVHKDEERIKIDFPFNQEIASKVRQIPDARWSRTLGAWHIPYNEETYGQLIKFFPDIEISNTEMGMPAKRDMPQKAEVITVKPEKDSAIDRNEIVIEVSGKSIVLKMPKNDTDILFIRTFQYVRWDNAHFRWVVPNYGKNL